MVSYISNSDVINCKCLLIYFHDIQIVTRFACVLNAGIMLRLVSLDIVFLFTVVYISKNIVITTNLNPIFHILSLLISTLIVNLIEIGIYCPM